MHATILLLSNVIMEVQEALLNSCTIGDFEAASTYLQQCIQYGVDLNFVMDDGTSLVARTVISAAEPLYHGGRHIDVLQYLLQAQVNLESVDHNYGRTAAHWAAYTGQSQMLGLLILAGSPMAVYDVDGLTPFHAAIVSQSKECIDITLQLMSADRTILEIPSATGLTPLMLAIQRGNHQLCQTLLNAGSDPNAIEETSQQSALHLAAEMGYGNIVELLMKNQCRLDANDARGVTPVHIAAALVQSNVLSVICDKVGSEVLDIHDTVGLTALMHACAAGSEECVKYILKKKTNVLAKDHTEGKTCLHWAAGQPSLSSSSIIQLLCKKRRQLIEETDQYGRTPLHLAAMCGNVEGIKALKAAGCNLNAIDTHEEYTALHWAAVGGQADVVTELLSLGCSPREMDKNGATALHCASQAATLTIDEVTDVSRHLGALDCIRVLLTAGVSVDVVDNKGQTPIHWALQYSNNQKCVQLLISEGADPKGKDDEGLTGLHIAAKYGATDNCQYLIETVGIHGNMKDSQGQTALFFSIESKALESSQYLLSIGCSPNHRNVDQRSPAHIAASVGSVEGLQLLLQYNGDFNLQSNQGATPLHDAAAIGETAALQFMLECGADPNINGDVSEVPSALHFAVSSSQADCVELLLQYGCNVNAIMLTEEDQPLSPMDYAAEDPTMLELIQLHEGKPGKEIYTPPALPPTQTPPTTIERETEEADQVEIQEQNEEPETKAEQEEDAFSQEELEGEEDKSEDRKKDAVLVKRIRPVISRPTSGMEVFDHVTPEVPSTQFPARRISVLSRAMSFLRQKSVPSDSIKSSVLGLYAAQATMMAAAMIGTPMGDKMSEIASKVATDTAEELKRQAEEIDYEPNELQWLEEPEKEPTPPPEPTPEVPPTPPPSPPNKVEFKMDPHERRMRKAKAQMDETKSLGYRAVEELLRAQATQARLRRQFVMSSLKEDCEKRKEEFLKEEAKARQEAETTLNKYKQKMEKASQASSKINEQIDQQLNEAYQQNQEIASVMRSLGVNPRPTVAEWIERKQEQNRTELKGTLKAWERSKQTREMAISVKQAVTTHRALQHVAWGLKKDLTAQMKALDQPTTRPKVDTSLAPRPTVFGKKKSSSFHSTDPFKPKMESSFKSRPHLRQPITSSEKQYKSSGCVRATPYGFMRVREEPEPSKRNMRPSSSSSLPDSMLWDMGQSYIWERKSVYSRINHRAYGPKDIHPESPLVFLPPDEYNHVKKSRQTGRTRYFSEHGVARANPSQQRGMVCYHSLADSYPSVKNGSRQTKTAPGQVLPMKIIDSSEVLAKITT